jgi:predicted transcriptional regulator
LEILPRLEYITHARRRLGLTQRKLARLTGLSTSMINQIESGRCRPSYETARKIFDLLGSLEGQSALKAGDICSRNLYFVQKCDTMKVAIDRMRSNSISQIPVFDGFQVVGIVTEDGLAKRMVETIENNGDLNMAVSTIMEPPPPIVDFSTPAKALVSLVRFSKCVLVSETGVVMGIITLTDTLKMVE